MRIRFNAQPARPASLPAGGLRLIADREGPQVFLSDGRDALPTWAGCAGPGEDALLTLPVRAAERVRATAEVVVTGDGRAEVAFSLASGGDTEPPARQVVEAGSRRLVTAAHPAGDLVLRMHLAGAAGQPVVTWRRVRIEREDGSGAIDVPFALPAERAPAGAPPESPPLRPAMEEFLVEWDWRMQDGIGTARAPDTYAAATARTLERGRRLLEDLASRAAVTAELKTSWDRLTAEYQALSARNAEPADSPRREDLWRRVHEARRRLAFADPLARLGPVAFVKQLPGIFSHQLTQYYGSCAKPGGGVFVLEAPGESMRCRPLTADRLPQGSYQHVDVSPDGRRLLFSYCEVPSIPRDREQCLDRVYHLYEVAADGTGLRQLTSGPYDDVAPRYLPDGKLIFTSTRRGGFHRCGRGPCPTYALALANADGSDPHPISFHETHEWDPAVLSDGRIIYTRWDYVDRNAVHYQQLWTVRPDGSDVRAYYGNNTLNPVGVWEARPVPASNKVMATAAAHHAMTAGSIILLDVTRGTEGLEPIARLTPDALFPESEAPVARDASGKPGWHAPAGVTAPPAMPVEARRWPGHSYRSPWPLSESLFLAAYGYEPLIGEPNANNPNLFGLYLVDAHGNKELVYRDLNIASLWPVPLRARERLPTVPAVAPATAGDGAAAPPGAGEGTFFLQDVRNSWPRLPEGAPVRRLRIVQVLPKSTPHINTPTVGLASASPGRQVLGTVPVEADGSAYFRAPAGIPLAFQALDDRGQAVQTMRSITYLQPGETASCVGCHEPRTAAPAARAGQPLAVRRAPSAIEPGPDGSNPLSFPLLVQGVLDARCVSCHKPGKADGGIVLTGQPQGRYTASYNALVKFVPFAAWGNGLSMKANSEPLTVPDHFGARGSKLMRELLAGHQGVTLAPAEVERLVTWMDANALFYGTFDPADQARQLRGERIEGPKVR